MSIMYVPIAPTDELNVLGLLESSFGEDVIDISFAGDVDPFLLLLFEALSWLMKF